jgi:hypothetical protein
VRGANTLADSAEIVTLQVRSRGKARKRLRQQGTATVAVMVTFSPDGGDPASERTRLKLVKN